MEYAVSSLEARRGISESRKKYSIEQGSHRIARHAKNLLVIDHYRVKVRLVNTVVSRR